ncbi:MAG: hypothetical protein R3254_00960 [Thiomicrorhabdus sp.]|nr:hypothetical protein [Thiomicrorhabdus sp.]
MNAMQDNFTAIAEAQTSAPTLVHSAIGESIFTGAMINKAKQSEGLQWVSGGGSFFYPSSGWWTFHNDNDFIRYDVEVNSSWWTSEDSSPSSYPLGLYVTNGSSFRIKGLVLAGSSSLYWINHES